MRDSSEQEANSVGRASDELSEFDLEISDLPPDQRSHFLLLKLADTRRRGLAAAQAFARRALYTFAHRAEGGAKTDLGEEEQFALEISDLPPSTRSHYLLLKLAALKARVSSLLPSFRRPAGQPRMLFTRTQRRTRIGQALSALGLCLALLLLLAGNVPDLRARLLSLFQPPTPTPVATPGSIYSSISIFPLGQGVPIIVDRHGQALNPAQGTPGPLPTICPQASTLQPFITPPDPTGLGGGQEGGLGGGPIWLTGFVGPTAALVDLRPLGTSLSHPAGQTIGWYENLTVFVQRDFSGKITLRGESQGPGGLVFFASNNVLDFVPTLTLNPGVFHLETLPSGIEWRVASVNIIVPFAGCYTLNVTWSSGSWSEYFAAGN